MTEKLIVILICYMFVTACSSVYQQQDCEKKGNNECQNGAGGYVLIEPKIDEDYVRKYNIPSLELYKNQLSIIKTSNWQKDDLTRQERDEALLECGSSDIWMSKNYALMKTLTPDEYNGKLLLIKRCMLNDGFTFLGDFSPCESNPIPACDLPVPKRETERRLNSEYCIKKAYVDACQPQSRERILNTEKCKLYPKLYFCDI
ncbi:MAG: hypothetical protein VX829_11185 [Pseudomonadota bacterium]|uniref:hypothetical protein n=1 Tax=Methylophaga aminisulfidivorans TaxID=230105 RepID=UPI0024E1D2C6|nr:hypothetical protein [Methylophaga aminisulfidivorans]MEC9413221.1 hypothetical protein [Pseudomonadota bacterium]